MKSTTPVANSCSSKESYHLCKSSVYPETQTYIDNWSHSMMACTIKGEEQVLTQIENEWDCVTIMHGNYIEPCFKPKSLNVDTHTDYTIDLAVFSAVSDPIVSKPLVSTCINESIVSAAADVQTPAYSPTTAHSSSTHSTVSGSDASNDQ